jgi:riboflavin kinase/FMN adenylyltransferase
LPAAVVSFAPHPLEVLRPGNAPPLLSTDDEKLALLAEAGVNYVLVIPFTSELSRFGAEQFVDEILLGRARMAELFIGYDHGFGRGRAGDADTLREIGARRGFAVNVVPPVLGSDQRPISSTKVRSAIVSGDLSTATDALGRFYSLSGEVVRGAGRGRLLGFPTVNVSLPGGRKLLPAEGVYAVRAHTQRGAFGGMLHLGPRPTFSEYEVMLEANLFDVDADFYGQLVTLEFVARLRDVVRFDGPDSLREQVALDEAEARRALTMWLQPNNMDSFTRNHT